MKTLYSVLVGIHVLTVLAMIGLLLTQLTKAEKKVPKGVTHAGLTAMVLGIAMIVINAVRHNSDKTVELLNHTKYGVKFLVLTFIVGLALRYAKKPTISAQIWFAMVGLSIFNLAIASSWK
jgi:hypothetical protein